MEGTASFVPIAVGDGKLGPRVKIETHDGGDPEQQVGVLDALSFDEVAQAVGEIATRLGDALKSATPHRASIELGVDVAVESGGLTALIVKGSGSAALTITLEWDWSESRGHGAG